MNVSGEEAYYRSWKRKVWKVAERTERFEGDARECVIDERKVGGGEEVRGLQGEGRSRACVEEICKVQ